MCNNNKDLFSAAEIITLAALYEIKGTAIKN